MMDENLVESRLFALEDEEVELIGQLQREAAMLQGRLVGVIESCIKRHHLPGRWDLSPDGRSIQKSEVPQ